MAKYEDYKHLQAEGSDELDKEIEKAQEQQEERASTPDVNWEDRYKELEKLNSRQAQELGQYRKMIDEYITTPDDEPEESVEPPQIDVDKLYDNPTETLDEYVSKHPAVRRAEKIEQKFLERERDEAQAQFAAAHPDFEEIVAKPEFANWVAENPTRITLAQRADGYDFSAADALFSLWKAETAAQAATSNASIDDVSLEGGSGTEAPAPVEYSRSEMLRMKTLAKQGNAEAEAYVKEHGPAYLKALSEGNIRP